MNRNILIIGGSRGIGAEAVRSFRTAGDNVVFTYHKSELEADDLRQETGAVPVRCDVKFSNSVRIAVDKAISVLGQIDVLVCCAAASEPAAVMDIEETRWEEIIATNLSGVFYCVKYVLPSMMSRGQGCIITVTAVNSRENTNAGAACRAAGAGVAGLTAELADEAGECGIRVICAAPDITRDGLKECAGLIEYLASPEGSFVNGGIYGSDGIISS